MKPKSAVPINSSNCCSHRSSSGRQCRALSTEGQFGLCARHRALQKNAQAADLTSALLSETQGFQTAQGVNFALRNLYKLLAADLISTRRASVLAFINSLILRTLPAIDADNAAGIKDPTTDEDDEATEDDNVTGDDDSHGEADSAPLRYSPSSPEPEPIRLERPTDAVLPLGPKPADVAQEQEEEAEEEEEQEAETVPR